MKDDKQPEVPSDAIVGLDDSLAALRSLLRAGSITPDIYHKGLVGLAYEYLLLGEATEAVGLLNTIPMDYFMDVQPVQMAEDAHYREVGIDFAQRLAKLGAVDLEDLKVAAGEFSFMQKPGLA